MYNQDEYFTYISRVSSFVFSVAIGVGCKVAFRASKEIVKNKEVLTSIGMALFVGYIIDQIATQYGAIALRGVFVSVSALISESIVKYWFDNDSNILKRILNVIFKSNGDK
ncbi:MAG: hypothetical protein ABI851_12215 [Saprospiraceae bacterium]